ncbi:F0F1 ATP synthase subunit delta [Marinobacterium aestuariivivens]|uniref:ATP synthase subunit b n=1 Tax=Marinobacterium aestuariivivens TaxID=1698799 RepID=A0ABW2A3C6_9GAMM
MELSVSTFLLEIINFLVLIWLLQRFFYQPLRAVIARRREGIDRQLDEARERQRQAEQLRSSFESRLSHWEQERQQAREKLQTELNREKARQETALAETLEREREKARASLERREQELKLQLEQQALRLAGRFAARLLEQSAGPELQQRLQTMLLQSLPRIPEDQRLALRERETEHPEPAEVTSAFELDGTAQEQIRQGLQPLLGRQVKCRFHEDPQLLAGLRISIGPWMFRASIRDELQSFADLALANGHDKMSGADRQAESRPEDSDERR